MQRSALVRWRRYGIPLFSALPLVLLLFPGCAASYVMKQGYYQGKLLMGRIDVSEALERPEVSEAAKERLRLVQEIRTFGEQKLKMSPTENYTTINLEWNQEIWNVSGCRELAFVPHTWWFPVVGTVPYKGFFEKADAIKAEEALKGEGFETALRRVGGYSTLGWFRDPILPHMLEYSEGDLANLVLHELAHATLFIPGHVDFNESFASFVGREAALRFLEARYGQSSDPSLEARALTRDEDRFNRFMHDLYLELDGIYTSQLSDAERRSRKAVALSKAREAYRQVPFESARYRGKEMRAVNNADLLQFRRYSGAQHQFEAVLERFQGDMSRFFVTFKALERGSDGPFIALAKLSGTTAVVNVGEAVQEPPP